MKNHTYRANNLIINDAEQNHIPITYYSSIYNNLLCFQLLKMTSLIYYLKSGNKHTSITKLCYLATIMLNDDHNMKPAILINQVKCDDNNKLMKKIAYLDVDRVYEEAAFIINLNMFINIAIVANYRGIVPFLPPELWFYISTQYSYLYKLPRRVPFSITNRTDFYLEYLLFNILYYKKKNIKRVYVKEKDYMYLEYTYYDYIGEILLVNNRYRHALTVYNRLNRRLYENNLYYDSITNDLESLYDYDTSIRNHYY